MQDLIHSIIKSISNFKESEASEPFRAEIDSLELKLIETNKKIDIIKKVESIFGIVSEVSTSYSLDLQLGKFQQKLNILTDIWRNIHQDISEHSGLVEAMNNAYFNVDPSDLELPDSDEDEDWIVYLKSTS